MTQWVKNLREMQETQIWSLSWEHHLEGSMATHCSILAWRIPWTEEPGGVQSVGSQRAGHLLSDFTFTCHFHALEKEVATHSSVLAWRIPGPAEPGGLPSMGSHRVGHDWSDLAAAAAVSVSTTLVIRVLQNHLFKYSFISVWNSYKKYVEPFHHIFHLS